MESAVNKKYKLVIIGKGPAGIQAAIYTSRARIPTVVIGIDAGSLQLASKVENYYGVSGQVSGIELQAVGEKQARSFGVDIIDSAVVGLGYSDDGFFVATPEKRYECKAVLLATGSSRVKAPVDGLERFTGKGVSYCAVCDGFLFKGKAVGVLGYTDYAAHEASELSAVTADVTIFTNGNEYVRSTADKEIKIETAPIASVFGDEKLSGIRFSDGREVGIDGLFVAYGIASGSDFARKIGVSATENGDIETDANQMTNIPGVFAAGDCTGGFLQLSKAVGQGAVAAKSIMDYLKQRT